MPQCSGEKRDAIHKESMAEVKPERDMKMMWARLERGDLTG
jgi:hypothetical protein